MAPVTRSLLVLVLLSACAPDLRQDFPFDGQPPSGNFIEFQDQGNGSQYLTVDATSKTSYAYLDLDTMAEINAESTLDPNAWDLSFQRYKVSGNSGSSGPGTVEIAVLTGADYDALTQAPADGYQRDGQYTVIGGDANGGWYFYDLNVHKLSSRSELTYAVRSTGGAYFKLKMLSYYDENGTAARLTMRVGKLSPP
jgi:hypothetical protein